MPDDGEDHAEQLPLLYYEEPEAYRARELDFLGRQGWTPGRAATFAPDAATAQ